jgi:hypothetical protein
MKRLILAVAISTMLFGAIGARSVSARGGGATCNVTPSPALVGQPFTVSVSGLPTNSPIYLWISNLHGDLTMSYLGTTATGTVTVTETASFGGIWSYQFTGPQKAKNTAIYATCGQTIE